MHLRFNPSSHGRASIVLSQIDRLFLRYIKTCVVDGGFCSDEEGRERADGVFKPLGFYHRNVHLKTELEGKHKYVKLDKMITLQRT